MIDIERVGLTATAIERQHQLSGEPLVGRSLRQHETLQLSDQVSVPAELKLGIDAALEGSHPQLLQPADLSLGEVLEGHFRQRRTPPQRQGAGQDVGCLCGCAGLERLRARADGAVERVGVQLVRGDREQIAATDRLQPRPGIARERLQRLAQARNRHLQPVVGVRTRRPPDGVDDRVLGDGAVRPQHQKGKQGQLARTPQGETLIAPPRLHRSQNPKTRQFQPPRLRQR